ncbi:hypothetical protein JL101_035875 (plasmid) [Skermanella rosea]|uniref:hypothetical protein n=1 Tax=Skermanella rosea TaxID=1817965 RepID=UPI001932B1ED|nr:hypothetical protein [Skermanella rosea]UEM08032.1 hypothetical protein JL101_035875 [Skermanella rosea]
MQWTNTETEAFASYIQTKRKTDPGFNSDVAVLVRGLDPKPLIGLFQRVAREELDWQGPYSREVNFAEVADGLIQAELTKWTDRIKAGKARTPELAR